MDRRPAVIPALPACGLAAIILWPTLFVFLLLTYVQVLQLGKSCNNICDDNFAFLDNVKADNPLRSMELMIRLLKLLPANDTRGLELSSHVIDAVTRNSTVPESIVRSRVGALKYYMTNVYC